MNARQARAQDADPFTFRAFMEIVVFALVIMLFVFALSGCGAMPLEVCMQHPRYGQVCVTVVGGRVTKVNANVGLTSPDDEAELTSWAQERVK